MDTTTRSAQEAQTLQDDIFAKLRWGINHFSVRQSVLCQYILENYQQVAFWSVEELSQNSGVSPATVVRTVKSLGYPSYHQLLKCFEKLIIDNKTSVFWETEHSWKGAEVHPSLTWISRDNIHAIRNSVTPNLLAELEKASEVLQRARRIFIVALRTSRSAGMFFYLMLSQSFDNIHIIQYGADELYDKLVDLGPSDAVVAISLGGPHYTRTTIQAARFTKKNGVPTVVVVNDPAAPAAEYADVTLVAAQTQHHYSLVPTLTVLEALAVELGRRKKNEATRKMRKLETVLSEEEVLL